MASGRFRTKLCRNYALGHCPQGDQCKYLHSNNIPGSTPYPMAPQMVPMIVGVVNNCGVPSLTWTTGQQRGHSGFNPHFSFPISTAVPNFPWPMMSPPIQSAEMGGFNWIYPPVPAPALPPPQTSQPPQFRPLSWRTTLCRHFVKNQGWCPLGDDCGYIHDMALAAHALEDVRVPGKRINPIDESSGGHSSGQGRAGTKHSHCWAYVQGLCRVKDCPYLHPAAIHLFVPHTPCLAWPNCTRGALCAYKHPESLGPRAPELQPQAPAPAPPGQMQPVSPVEVSPIQVMPGMQFHGTTYFSYGNSGPPPMRTHPHSHAPAAQPLPPAPVLVNHRAHAPAPPPSSMSSPHYTYNYANYSPAVNSIASGFSPYSPESASFHSPYYETVSSLPSAAVPRAFTGPNFEEFNDIAGMPMSTLPPIPEPVEEETQTKEPAKREDPFEGYVFPYRPQPGQRAGHARRVSVALKSKEDSDALGVPAHSSTRRESWQGHRNRDDPAHRSWHSQSLQLTF